MFLSSSPGSLALVSQATAFSRLSSSFLRAASRCFRQDRRSADWNARFGATISLGVTAALVGFLVSGLMEWNLGDEELLDLLYVMVGVAIAAPSWAAGRRASREPGDLALVEPLPDQSFGAMANRRRTQETSPPSPAR